MTSVADNKRVLIIKQLTFSDASYDVSKTGRVVLPRAQVEECLQELLLLGGAKDALVALASSDSLRLAVELSMQDQFGNEWTVTMKTWQNVVAGQHRPTFVLENTMTPFKALGLRQGHSLAICEVDGRLQMRNDIPAPNARAGTNPSLKKKGSAKLSIAQRTINKSAKKASRSASIASTIVGYMPSADSPSPSSEDLAAATALVSMSSEELCDLRSRDFNGPVISKKDVEAVNKVAMSDRRAEDEGSQTSQGSELNRIRSDVPDYNRVHCYVDPTMTMRKSIVQSGGNIWPVGHTRYHQLQPAAPPPWSQSHVQKHAAQQLHLEAESRIWHEISNLLTPRIIFAASQALLQGSQRPGSPVCPEPGMFSSKVVGPAPSVTLASTAIGNLW